MYRSGLDLQCGLNAGGLSDDETGLLPPGADEERYAEVRNAVLAQWRRDVSKKLPLSEALAAVAQKDRPYALAAWHFLHGQLLRFFCFYIRK